MRIHFSLHIGRRTFSVAMNGPRIAIDAHKKPKEPMYVYKQGHMARTERVGNDIYSVIQQPDMGMNGKRLPIGALVKTEGNSQTVIIKAVR